MGDYIFPSWVVKILKAPSERTQMESSLVGITIMMLASLCLVSYMIINGVVTGFWLILLVCSSELGLLSFQFSLLTTSYQTYRQYKLQNGMYPEEYKLKLKIDEAKYLKEELTSIIAYFDRKKMKGGKV